MRTINTRLVIEEASCQAFFRFSLASKLVKVGIKADPNAPPATRLNKVSEILLAALKASIEEEVPKASATRIWRIKPVRLLITKARVTTPAARAICRLAERELGQEGSVLTIKNYNITRDSQLGARFC